MNFFKKPKSSTHFVKTSTKPPKNKICPRFLVGVIVCLGRMALRFEGNINVKNKDLENPLLKEIFLYAKQCKFSSVKNSTNF